MSSCWPFSSVEREALMNGLKLNRAREHDLMHHRSCETIVAVALCPRLSVGAIVGINATPPPPRSALSSLVKQTILGPNRPNNMMHLTVSKRHSPAGPPNSLSVPSLSSISRGSLILRNIQLQVSIISFGLSLSFTSLQFVAISLEYKQIH